MTIMFSSPVAGAGAQIQYNATGPFAATLKVYDPSSNLIGTVGLVGDSNSNADNSAIFLGAQDSSADIGSIVFSALRTTGLSTEDFAINRLSLTSNAAAVPEPSTLALLGSGLPVFSIAMRMGGRKRRTCRANRPVCRP